MSIKMKKLIMALKIDFVKHTLKWVLLSLIIIIAGTIITTKYGLNLGIDYRGGSNVTIINNDKFTIEQIKMNLMN